MSGSSVVGCPYIHKEPDASFIAPSGGVVANVPIIIGALCVVPERSAAVGEAFPGHLTGVFKLPKASADVVAAGAQVDWDPTPGNIVVAGSVATNWDFGYAVRAAGNGDTEIIVAKTVATATPT